MNPQPYYLHEGRLEMMSWVETSPKSGHEEMPQIGETTTRESSYKGIVTRIFEYFQDHPEERKRLGF